MFGKNREGRGLKQGLCDSPLERGAGVCSRTCWQTHPCHNTGPARPLSRGELFNDLIFNQLRGILHVGQWMQ